MEGETLARYHRSDFNDKYQMMYNFIKEDRMDCIQHALSLDPPLISMKDLMGETLLVKGVLAMNEKAVRLLLNEGCPVNEKTNAKTTALFSAIKNAKSASLVKILLEHGADINSGSVTVQSKLKTPLDLALESNELDVACVLLEHDPNLLTEKMWLGILIKSIVQYNVEMFGYLLKVKKFLNCINEEGSSGLTPLMHACEISFRRNTIFIEGMLDNKASMYVRDKQGRDAFFIAVQHANTYILTIFVKRGYRFKKDNLLEVYKEAKYPNAIFIGIENHPICYDMLTDLINLALKYTPEVINHTNRQNQTILHLAAITKHDHLYRFLVGTPINREILDSSGRKAFNIRGEFTSFRALECSMTTLIKKCDYEGTKAGLSRGLHFDIDHVELAVKQVDSELPKISQFNPDDQVKILFLFFENSIETWRNNLIEVVLTFAFALNKFKVIHHLRKFTAYTVPISGFIKSEKSQLILSFDMIESLNAVCRRLLYKDNGKILVNNDRDPAEMLQKDLDIFYGLTISKFLYVFTAWKLESKHEEEFYLNALTTAVNFRREDIATVLLQQGPNPNLDEKHENLIELHFNEDFKELYKESKGRRRLLSLEETARLAVRRNLPDLHDQWLDYTKRPIIKFPGKNIDVKIKDESKRTALIYAIEHKKFHIAQYIFTESEISQNQYIESLFEYLCSYRGCRQCPVNFFDNWNFSNPLFPFIRSEDYKQVSQLIETNEVDVNDFYGELFNALHYALICWDPKMIELLINHGANDAVIKCKPFYSLRPLALRIYDSIIDDYLKKKGFVLGQFSDDRDYISGKFI